jgi:hypothetical protein
MAEGGNTDLMALIAGYGLAKNAGKGMKKAGKIIGKTADENIAFAKDIANQNIAQYQPLAQLGQSSLDTYKDYLNRAGQGDFSWFQNTPDYNVGYNALINSANRGFAMRGNSLGGGAVRDIARLGADYTSQKFNEALNRPRQDTILGYEGVNQVANQRSNLGNTFINQNTMKGTGFANALIGKTNIWSKMLEDALKASA